MDKLSPKISVVVADALTDFTHGGSKSDSTFLGLRGLFFGLYFGLDHQLGVTVVVRRGGGLDGKCSGPRTFATSCLAVAAWGLSVTTRRAWAEAAGQEGLPRQLRVQRHKPAQVPAGSRKVLIPDSFDLRHNRFSRFLRAQLSMMLVDTSAKKPASSKQNPMVLSDLKDAWELASRCLLWLSFFRSGWEARLCKNCPWAPYSRFGSIVFFGEYILPKFLSL